MRLGIRSKLFLVSLGLIVATVVPADAILTHGLEADLLARIRDDLAVRLALAEKIVSAAVAAVDDLAAWDALADELGRRSGCRVTLVRKDGVVVGDSEVELERVAALDNHADRPEIAGALVVGHGASVRWSKTLAARLMYVAVPFVRSGTVAGTVRLAMPLAAADAAISAQRRVVYGGSVLALLLALVLASFAAGQTARGVRAVAGFAQRIAAGELVARSKARGHDEVADLSRALDQLADNLARAIASVQAERDLLTGVLRGMREGVLVLDARRRVTLANAALREMLLLGNDLVARSAVEIIRNAELLRLLDEVAAAGAVLSREIELGDLKPRRILIHAGPLAGTPGELLAVFVDVTELRRLETLRRDFVANVSHELRTPIAAVGSAAETLRRAIETQPEAAGEFVEIIERQAERLRRLVDDLMDLSRIESRQLKLAPEPILLRPFVERALQAVIERARARGIELKNLIAADLPALAADRRALEQVLTNLVDNAVKYASQGATVTIGASLAAGRMRLTVSDTGPGIEARHLPRLFERFYRVDPGRSRDLGGTGLGLSIVKHLVEAMRGTVEVESVVGEGSTFVVELPAMAA
ncbi:MAG: PAS domain-containing protein [Deltaproteobacteria bacterium]|nr:PAS domain-containing protein [Deltaproteobacteria bacterium]